ncbi:MAG TPA: S8 family serine peptidase [Xanthomonadaceae bacterium]|nr:S8 family serine peptidase [Xanthomonadaceae bacterium]
MSAPDEQAQRLRAVMTPAERRKARFDPLDPETVAYLEYLEARQLELIATIEGELGREIKVVSRFVHSGNGITTWLTPEEADRIARIPGVSSLVREPRPPGLGADLSPSDVRARGYVWQPFPGGTDAKGLGKVIAILDSGIDILHPAFQNDPRCGHGEAGNPDKLLSVFDCTDATGGSGCTWAPNSVAPLDRAGHGTAVAGTAAGNELDENSDPAPFRDLISGVAPCASLRSYKVCEELEFVNPATGQAVGCATNHIRRAIEHIRSNPGVHVANLSVAADGFAPWTANGADRLLADLVSEGITVTTVAGNVSSQADDRAEGTVQHLAPWLLTTANIEVRRDPEQLLMNPTSRTGPVRNVYRNLAKPDIGAPGTFIYLPSVKTMIAATGPGDPPALATDVRMFRASHSSWLLEDLPDEWLARYTEHPAHAEGCEPFPADYFQGRFALMRVPAICPRATQAANALDAGARGAILIAADGQPDVINTVGQPTDFAVYSSPRILAQWLTDFLDQSGQPIGTDGREIPVAIEVGRSHYDSVSGTSIAAPHVAGAAALILEQRPDLSPMEVASLLMTTAQPWGFKPGGKPWDADDVGAGMLDVSSAIRAPLVMHEDVATMLAADPAAGGDPTALNLPSLRDMDCSPTCTFTRRFRHAGKMGWGWSVSSQLDGHGWSITADPSVIEIAEDDRATEVEVEFTVTPPAGRPDEINYGRIQLSPHDRVNPMQQLTVAIRGDSQPLSGFLLDYSIEGVGNDRHFVLTPTASYELHPSVYSAEHAQPDGADAPGFVRMPGYYENRFPDGIEAGNTDWQGLGTEFILTWNAGGPLQTSNRYHQFWWESTLFLHGKRLCDVLAGTGGIAGAAIRTLPDGGRMLAVVTYQQGTRTFNYLERNWAPGIQYANDLAFDPNNNPWGWQLVHSAVHESYTASGQQLLLRSGVYFDDAGTRAVGLLRSNPRQTSDQPWAEVEFEREAGFEFRYFQTGRFRAPSAGTSNDDCEAADLGGEGGCSQQNVQTSSSAFSHYQHEASWALEGPDVHPQQEEPPPWAQLTDHAVLAIDFRNSEITRLYKRLVAYEGERSGSRESQGSYTTSHQWQCQGTHPSSRVSTWTAQNTYSEAEREDHLYEERYFLDEEPLLTGSHFSHEWSYAVEEGSAGGTKQRTTIWSPPGSNPESTTTDSYTLQFRSVEQFHLIHWHVAVATADLRAGFVGFADFRELVSYVITIVSSGGGASLETTRSETASITDHFGLHLFLDGALDFTHTDVHEVMNYESEEPMQAPPMDPGSYGRLIGTTSTECNPWGPGEHSGFQYLDSGGISYAWFEMAYVNYLYHAKLGDEFGYVLRTVPVPYMSDPNPSFLRMRIGKHAFENVIREPEADRFDVGRLSVF